VLGVVTKELFDKDAYIEKGKPPYYAAIPFEAINNAFDLNLWGEIMTNPVSRALADNLE
jgi:hypothetical protein